MIKTGVLGEDIASKFLENKGFFIISRNYRKKYGEIDVIAKDLKGVLVFVEVKTVFSRLDGGGISPEDELSFSKIEKTRRISEAFANSHPELMNERVGWRIDAIGITLPPGLNVENLPKNLMDVVEIRHHENI